jgi:transcriptional regulator NrdR family protein
MVCILCDSKTITTNSRGSKTEPSRWRRHTCTRCAAVFTTRETIEYSGSYSVRRADGRPEQFNTDMLYASILDAVAHRAAKFTDARALTNTVLARIHASKRLTLDIRVLTETVGDVLIRFDRSAYMRYISIRSGK